MKALLYEDELVKELHKQIAKAKTFHIAMALIKRTGISEIRTALIDCLGRGGSGKILIGLDLPTEPRAIELLRRIQKDFPRLSLRIFTSRARVLHAKLMIFQDWAERAVAIVGSSNLTGAGLTENYEANVLVSNDTANALLIYFDELFAESRAQEITDDWLQHYRAVWKERRESEKKWRRDRERVQRLNLKFLDKKAPLRGVEGLAFCFTGRIEGWHREQRVYPAVRALHGRIVTRARDIRSANYLVHGGILGGEKTTRKLAEARRNNIPIIGVDQFLQALYREAKRQRRPGIVRREGRWIIPAWPAFTPVP